MVLHRHPKTLDDSADWEDVIIGMPADKQERTDFGREVIRDLSKPEHEYANPMRAYRRAAGPRWPSTICKPATRRFFKKLDQYTLTTTIINRRMAARAFSISFSAAATISSGATVRAIRKCRRPRRSPIPIPSPEPTTNTHRTRAGTHCCWLCRCACEGEKHGLLCTHSKADGIEDTSPRKRTTRVAKRAARDGHAASPRRWRNVSSTRK